MFPVGVFLLMFGYALLYTGVANLLNGGQGPTLSESMGLKVRLAPPGADRPIGSTIGQAPSNPPAPRTPQ